MVRRFGHNPSSIFIFSLIYYQNLRAHKTCCKQIMHSGNPEKSMLFISSICQQIDIEYSGNIEYGGIIAFKVVN